MVWDAFSNGLRELGNIALFENKIIFKFSFTMLYGENYFILLLKYTKPTIYTEHEMYIMVINDSDQQF